MVEHSNKLRICSALVLLIFIFALTACGQQNVTEDTSAVQENFTTYACEAYNAEEANVRMQLDINPSFILNLTAEGNVMSIEANNEDAEDVILNYLGDYFNGVSDGIELEYVLRDLGKAIQQGGYIEDTLDVSVTILSGNIEKEVLEEACERATTTLAEDDGILASFEGVTDTAEASFEEVTDTAEASSEDQNMVCDVCNGEGTIVCDLCNGEGSVIEIEEHEEEVRNDYVCPYCGGAGILDDGLHGGETAVCGFCGGDGATGPMSGDFRELAFDKVTVQEEVSRKCSRCDGSGTLTCPNCEGTGVIE